MAIVDLKSAYRSVGISRCSQQVTGLQWTFPDGQTHTFIDKKLPFGSKLAPGIFHRLSQAIRRMMSRRGFTVIAYLDDFFICECTKQRCALGLRVLIDLLRKLGFAISWSKVFDPCQKLVFLGVEIDSTTLELRLHLTKLEQLRAELAEFKQRKHVSKKQLQSLAGKLNWASSVVHGGRVFLRRIIDGITKLKHDWHKMRLGGDILHDIHLWYNFMSTFNGKSLLLNTDPVTSVYTDACKTGAGGIFGTDWFYVNWKEDFPFAQSLHINEQEAFAVALAAKRWAKCWQNRHVFIFCDNSSTVSCINKCTSKNKLLMTFLRELFWLSASYNFHLVAIHLPGKENDMADAVSRYIAFLSQKLCFNSISNYISIIKLLHLEAGQPPPIDSHYIHTVLQGAKRVLGTMVKRKLPITPQLLKKILTTLDLQNQNHISFWAACLVAFFSFFRKSNLFVPTLAEFDAGKNQAGVKTVQSLLAAKKPGGNKDQQEKPPKRDKRTHSDVSEESIDNIDIMSIHSDLKDIKKSLQDTVIKSDLESCFPLQFKLLLPGYTSVTSIKK
ncbi:uncharacterized protein LOC143084063 [Mytilus galloprovincialis]|uniref:uncharacterized protein LOC143084063 n=1 Tax=Mytilus galloprovincialis TaxID=29158 RepID=UPI003F7C901D